MENTINPNGALLKKSETIPPAESAALSDEPAARHERSPMLRRSGWLLTMALTALCGAVGGAVSAVYGGAAAPAAVSSFLALFLSVMLRGCTFLLAEYIIGFFALGEWIVWLAPLCCGLGTGMVLFSCRSWLMLPSCAVIMSAVVFGANTSGEFSALLLRLVRGRSNAVIMTGSAAVNYTLQFLAYTAAVCAAALFEAGVRLSLQ